MTNNYRVSLASDGHTFRTVEADSYEYRTVPKTASSGKNVIIVRFYEGQTAVKFDIPLEEVEFIEVIE